MDPTNLYRSRFPNRRRGSVARDRSDPHQEQRGKMSARPGNALLAPFLESLAQWGKQRRKAHSDRGFGDGG